MAANEASMLQRKAAAEVGFSKLRSHVSAMLICGLLFFITITCRLELQRTISWPLYLDFVPLWILPCLVYLACADFAATRIAPDAALGKAVVTIVGFLVALALLFTAIFSAMRLEYIVDWPWAVCLSPLLLGVLSTLCFLCFLIPGFLKVDRLGVFYVIFSCVWLLAGTVLMVALKLDNELPGGSSWLWTYCLTPLTIVFVLQVIFLGPARLADTATRALCLTTTVLLGLQLDQILVLPWALVWIPVLVALLIQVCFMTVPPVHKPEADLMDEEA